MGRLVDAPASRTRVQRRGTRGSVRTGSSKPGGSRSMRLWMASSKTSSATDLASLASSASTVQKIVIAPGSSIPFSHPGVDARLAARLLACQRQPEKSGLQPEPRSARETRSRASLLATACRAPAVRRWLCSRCPRRGHREVGVLLIPPRERACRRAGWRWAGSASEAHADSLPISIVRSTTPRAWESASICTSTSASACPHRVDSSLSPVLGSSRTTVAWRTPGSRSMVLPERTSAAQSCAPVTRRSSWSACFLRSPG